MLDISGQGLHWLPSPPNNFRKLVKATVEDNNGAQPLELIRLAKYNLSLDQLLQLDKYTHTAGISEVDGIKAIKLAIISQGTTEFIEPAIRASCLRYSVVLHSYTPSYGQSLLEVLSPVSEFKKFNADIALIAESAQSLGLMEPCVSLDEANIKLAKALDIVQSMVEGVRGAGVKTLILQTIALPADPWCGHYDSLHPGSTSSLLERFNQGLIELAKDINAIIFDANRLAAYVGRERWFDQALWYRAKIPMALDFIPFYAESFAQVLKAMLGKSSKCLVLDLDNTCWGGVIGDDGLEGIRIGQGSAEGEAFLAVQKYALRLKQRGIVLAVCSKNNEVTAKLPFEKHPDMLLKLEDIAVFNANWEDKASNLAHIAETLNIGIDSLVFLDDNPAERERVRQMLPQVSVPELLDDASYYPTALAQGGYFEAIGLNEDDAKRAEQYIQNAERNIALTKIGNYEEYLSSLEMVCQCQHFDSVGRSRIAQLINKSNQFNLTTRRYSEAEVAEFEKSPQHFTLQVRLADKFGDNGVISVIIFECLDSVWTADLWLMSCRVLGRRVEEAVLSVVVQAAKARNVTSLYGDYIPTPKNSMVADLYDRLGFKRLKELDGGGVRWKLSLEEFREPELPIKVIPPNSNEIAMTGSI